MNKKICTLFFSILIIFSLSACSGTVVWENKKFDKDAAENELSDKEVIAENEKYRLEWVSSNCSVSLTDKQTGLSWGTTPESDGEQELDMFGLPVKKHPQLESALVVEYLNDSTDVEEQTVSYTGAVNEGRVSAELIENGVRVRYYFDSVEIMVPVEYVLREDSVAISVDAKEIEENNFRVTSVAVTPFWCSAKNGSEDSYIFIPSGSGAVVYPETLSQTGSTYSEQVYGSDPVMKADDLPSTRQSVRLPVYGAKTGDRATCAIIEEASESAVIEAKIGSSAIQYTGVYAKFQVRGYSPNLAQFMQGLEKKLNIYSRSMVDTKMTVGFYPLTGENADYSGMASVYRNYLKENSGLERTEDDSAWNITFIGGMTVNKSFLGIPYTDVLPATTLEQAEEILGELSESTDIPINARLAGFGETGIGIGSYAGGYSVNKNLGDLSGLSDLTDFCSENNINLYFDFDIMSLKGSGAGYSKLFDTAYSALNKTAELYEYNVATRSRIEDTKYNLLKRGLLVEAGDKLLDKIKKWNISGISLSSLSNTAYSDYSEKDSVRYYSKSQMGSDVTEIFEKVSEKYRTASSDANAYAAVLSETVYDAPLSSSEELAFSADVPFYEMVFKGCVHMSGTSVNMASDSDTQILKAVESGTGLAFTLCSEWINEFIDNTGYEFFGSEYSGIKEEIKEYFSSLSDYYKAVNGSEIDHHAILENGLRETVFSNGVKVYVNYSDTDKASQLGNVPAGGFLWGGDTL